MARMGRYCKAYTVSTLERYPRWRDHARVELLQAVEDGEEAYAFMHEDLKVTADVFMDEAVVFDALSPEWEQFCRDELGFAVPDECLDAPEESPIATATAAASGARAM